MSTRASSSKTQPQTQPQIQAQIQAQQLHLNPQQFLNLHIQMLQTQIQQHTQNPNNPNNQLQLQQLQAQLQNQLQLQMQLQAAQAANQWNAPGQAQGQGQVQGLGQNPANALQQQPPVPAQNQNPIFNQGQQAAAWILQHHALAPPPAIVNAIAAHVNAPTITPPNPQSALKAQPREGSWLSVIDIISPGANLSTFASEHSQHDAERATALQTIHFKSCGYARLPYSHFDQQGIEPTISLARTAAFAKKYNGLAPAMLSAKWPLLGEIVQDINITEATALNAGWDLVQGWEDRGEAEEVEFDGWLAGGTGRISGSVGRLPVDGQE